MTSSPGSHIRFRVSGTSSTMITSCTRSSVVFQTWNGSGIANCPKASTRLVSTKVSAKRTSKSYGNRTWRAGATTGDEEPGSTTGTSVPPSPAVKRTESSGTVISAGASSVIAKPSVSGSSLSPVRMLPLSSTSPEVVSTSR